LSDIRSKKDGDTPVYYDEHGLDQQRAYQIVCLMVGSNPLEFAGLANDAKLPEDRQRSCKQDWDDASTSWDALLKPHRRIADQPKVDIDVAYGDSQGDLGLYAKGFQLVQLLESVRDYLSNEFALPRPFALEAKSCGAINAAWVAADRKLTYCYELAADFADLYRVRGVKLRSTFVTPKTEVRPGYVAAPEAERIAANYQRQAVFYRTTEAPGTLIVSPAEHYLYFVQGKNRALRYGVSVSQDCLQWAGALKVTRKAEWPEWRPSAAMIARKPELPHVVEGGPGNPLGARALYLGNKICQITGTNQPQTIGQLVRSGCFHLTNSEVIDLYDRVPVGTKVIIRQAPET
jgi:lipoprotein-anchoring transpeptidase ErfK/SrfK